MPTMSSSDPVADRQRADPERFGCHEGLGASVSKVDDLTVEFQLTRPNPRFQLDYFSVRIWGGVNIVPEHIWNGQDPGELYIL